ncbi:TPA: hypothetical protein DEP34_01060 [Candidatus Uhrbacteria bacterium]|uniref:Glycosyl transferase, WecB/TagA/CpsF family n=2 Tax=Candidatus Uhriibacteriota TaxID=1752732 RepID=A0A0G1T6J7_9BACT|nr:MAG: Glycosyl transferase, WecB/TagA/CpsF family [Candidatus Uhrbacteria bacterium GW2011_GWF2_46_218]KKU41000.1 MAG: Glycosyl transferase, WecB/TagA/CpsF family [Candidatus Uhrbacteria bacterium GW2011_GWE2_46_68]HBK33639.1 hypothetical protein [Candidatus Uhrbacteria bacterium]HCB18960.1 hypothetical protein [Candidatus Uhrbacteria bacterium]
MKKTCVLDIPVCALSREKIHELLLSFFDDPGFHAIATVNPEMLVASHNHKEFQQALQKMSLCVADGVGVSWLVFLTQGRGLQRLTGNDIIHALLMYAALHKKTVFLLGSTDEVIGLTLQKLHVNFPHLQIFGESGGELLYKEGEWKFKEDAQVVGRIQEVQPDILFVALGHEKQERWILGHKDFFPSVKIAVGVGGAFDFLSGKIKRAPKIFQRFGFEWLWRLWCEPKRLKRIFTAVIIFPTLVIWDTIRKLFVRKKEEKNV